MPKRLLAFLLPRPQGLVHKGAYFWIGVFVVLPIATPEIVSDHLPLYNQRLFTDMPHLLAVMLIAVLGFFVLEILLQQAKFLWNDLRDQTHDATLAHSNMRFTVQGVITPESGRIHFILRWGLALVLGWFLSPLFFAVLVAISIHQLLYEWVFKPNSDRYPLPFLLFLCLNLPLRVIGGYTAFLSAQVILEHAYLLVILGVMYLLSMGSLSTLYYLEAKDSPTESPRKHSPFFLNYGKQIVWGSQLLALVVAFILYIGESTVDRASLVFYGNLLLFVIGVAGLLSNFIRHQHILKLQWQGVSLGSAIYALCALLGSIAIVSMFQAPVLEWALSLVFTYTSFNYFYYVEQ